VIDIEPIRNTQGR